MNPFLENEILSLLDSLNVDYSWHEEYGEIRILNYEGRQYIITIDFFELSPEEMAAGTLVSGDQDDN